jgi:hypothetical protein
VGARLPALPTYSIATAEFGTVTGLELLTDIARVEFWPAFAAWVLVLAAMDASFARVISARVPRRERPRHP